MANYDKEPKDLRSTGRKRARKVLFETERPYCCRICGVTTINPPPDAPANFEEFWPEARRELESTYSLQAQHINKQLMDVDPVNLEWLCASCHKLEDSQTSKGVSLIEDEHGYLF